MKRYESVDDYIEASEQWQKELIKLRKIMQATPLEETVKWGAPCYTFEGKNVVGIGAFKSYVGLWFYQGALLSDPHQVLMNAQEGKTKAMRQWRFESGKEIRATWIKAYVKEAISQQQEGMEIKAQRKTPLAVPVELRAALAKSKKADAAFSRLTPGKQREYAEYIKEAKRAATKETRIKKIVPMIAAGHGLNDKYRNC